jgi:hypothetical protein
MLKRIPTIYNSEEFHLYSYNGELSIDFDLFDAIFAAENEEAL